MLLSLWIQGIIIINYIFYLRLTGDLRFLGDEFLRILGDDDLLGDTDLFRGDMGERRRGEIDLLPLNE